MTTNTLGSTPRSPLRSLRADPVPETAAVHRDEPSERSGNPGRVLKTGESGFDESFHQARYPKSSAGPDRGAGALDDVARLMLHRYHCAEPPKPGEKSCSSGLENVAVVGIAMLRWRSLPAQASGVLLAFAVLHAAATPLIKAQFEAGPEKVGKGGHG